MRKALATAVVCLGATAWMVPRGLSARADDGDGAPITVNAGQTVSQDYPAILGQDPATGQIQDHDPDTCRQVAEATCTVIPIKYNLPQGFHKYDVYTSVISVIWDPGQNIKTGNSAVTGADANDLDIYLWFNPYDANDKRYKDGSTALNHSASTDVPEQIKVDASSAQDFLLVVNNSNGVNQGFTVKVESAYSPFGGVTESLDNGFTKPVDLSADASVPAASAPDAGVRALPAAPVAAAPAPASVTPDVAGLDPSLTGLTGSGADSALNTGAAANLFKPAAAIKPPKPVSGLTMVFACGVIPALLIALGAVWFRRRRPVALVV